MRTSTRELISVGDTILCTRFAYRVVRILRISDQDVFLAEKLRITGNTQWILEAIATGSGELVPISDAMCPVATAGQSGGVLSLGLFEFAENQHCLAATPLGIDNKGALALAHDYVSNNKTKHIERRHLRIRELVEDGTIAPEYVPTEDNVADILTKPLGRRRFEKLRRKLLNHA